MDESVLQLASSEYNEQMSDDQRPSGTKPTSTGQELETQELATPDNGNVTEPKTSDSSNNINTPPDMPQCQEFRDNRSGKESKMETQEHPRNKSEEMPETIFRVKAIEAGKSDRLFYSDKPFEGLRDFRQENETITNTLFDVYTDVEGKWLNGRFDQVTSMKRSDWSLPDRRIDFRTDFDVTSQRNQMIIIHDEGIRWAFQTLVKYDPDRRVSGKSIPIHWPFSLILWYYKDLKLLQQQLLDEEGDHHLWRIPPTMDIAPSEIANRIGRLLNFVQPLYDTTIEPEIKLQEMHFKDPNIHAAVTFEYLWLLLRPGETAFVKVDGDYSAVTILEAKEVQENTLHRRRDSGRHFRVSVWNYRLVHGMMVRHKSIIRIEDFQDHKQINLLPVFPCRYHEEYKERCKMLVERGKRFFRYARQEYAHLHYNGKTLDQQPREYTGHIVLDSSAYVTYLYLRPQFKQSERRFQEYLDYRYLEDARDDINRDPLTPSQVVEPDDSGGGVLWEELHEFDPRTIRETKLQSRHYMLFPRRIMGMIVKDKQWTKFDIEKVTEIPWPNSDALKDLVLRREDLDMLKAACPSPGLTRNTSQWSADYVQGKGDGQVFLLHGPPGTGKTFTAECMAKHNKQILLALTVGDLGTKETQAEFQLTKWFDLARKWKAILLVDEADVFMETRVVKDLHRNSLVSVFLRTMEYYEGTLFLTTNRIGQLDPAISSRIQIAIYYPPFGFQGRSTSRLDQVKIWENLLDKLYDERPEVFVHTHTRESILDTSNIIGPELNGREIRNAFSLAIRLSEYGAVHRYDETPQRFELRLDYIKRAVKMREIFKKQCHRAAVPETGSEQERAEMMQDRGPHIHDEY